MPLSVKCLTSRHHPVVYTSFDFFFPLSLLHLFLSSDATARYICRKAMERGDEHLKGTQQPDESATQTIY